MKLSKVLALALTSAALAAPVTSHAQGIEGSTSAFIATGIAVATVVISAATDSTSTTATSGTTGTN